MHVVLSWFHWRKRARDVIHRHKGSWSSPRLVYCESWGLRRACMQKPRNPIIQALVGRFVLRERCGCMQDVLSAACPTPSELSLHARLYSCRKTQLRLRQHLPPRFSMFRDISSHRISRWRNQLSAQCRRCLLGSVAYMFLQGRGRVEV
jgi:hypothetical protein